MSTNVRILLVSASFERAKKLFFCRIFHPEMSEDNNENDDDEDDIEFIEIDILIDDNDWSTRLPPHRRCAAHTLNCRKFFVPLPILNRSCSWAVKNGKFFLLI